MRAVLIVLDSVGAGAMPDAARFGDEGADTLGHVSRAVGGLSLPNLGRLGLGNLHPVEGVPPVARPEACHGRAALASAGKDTVAGHWEMTGVVVETPFRTFPDGFPPEIREPFEREIGRQVLANRPASGTEIIAELGEEHRRTGRPILYTSGDSVFQVAAHEEVVPLARLYEWCRAAFRIVVPHGVARVIARPFTGAPGAFTRTHNRKDFAVEPPRPTILDAAVGAGLAVVGIGKIPGVFGGRGFTKSVAAGTNEEVVDAVLARMGDAERGLLFANLVEFDSHFGHRRDPRGYARALEAFDRRVPALLDAARADDLLILTADHGCDPTHRGTDHTREFVPVLAWRRGGRGSDLGTRDSLADLGATIAAWLGLPPPARGRSFRELL